MTTGYVVLEMHKKNAVSAMAASSLIPGILFLGIALRLLQYLGQTSLWHDELALARTIAERPLVPLLTQPLERAQVAPVGFVAAVKIATVLLGPEELGFRLVPLLASITALFLFWRIARRALAGWMLAGALLLLAVSPSLLWYGGNLKPYSGDVAFTMLLVLLALRHVERPDCRRRALAAGAIGAVVPFFSFPALIAAAVLGGLLALWWLLQHPRPAVVPLLTLLGPWAAGTLVAGVVAIALVQPSTREYMDRFWVDGFLPDLWWRREAPLWASRQLFAALGNILIFILAQTTPGSVYVGLCAAAALAGVVHLGRRSPWTTLFVLAPTLAALLGGITHLLPFRGRVALFAGWPLALATFLGLHALCERGGARRVAATTAGVLFGAVPTLVVLGVTRPPYRAQEARPVLTELANRRQPPDVLFGYYGAANAIAFYGPRVGLTDWVVGGCHRDDPPGYFHEIDRFRGRSRVWFFYTHSAIGYREPEVILSYLDTIGVLRDSIPDPFGNTGQLAAAAHLYDLSDPVRLATATAETHRHEPIATGNERILCDGTRVQPAR